MESDSTHQSATNDIRVLRDTQLHVFEYDQDGGPAGKTELVS